MTTPSNELHPPERPFSRCDTLRIVTWNTEGTSRKTSDKLALVTALRPHILALQECGRGVEAWLAKRGFTTRALFVPKRRGICLAVSPPCQLREPRAEHSGESASATEGAPTDILTVELDQPLRLIIDVLWVRPTPAQGKAGYVAKLKSILEASAPAHLPRLTLGDFNSSEGLGLACNPTPELSHAGNARLLNRRGQVSAFEAFTGRTSGQEGVATHWHMRREDRPFFIDHVFIPAEWAPRIRACRVLQDASWQAVSDHFPVVVDIDLNGSGPDLKR